MKKCSICDRPHVAKGLCSTHYEQVRARRRYKTINPIWHLSMPERLEYYSIPISECGCIIWIGGVDKDGYGKIYFENRNDRAHRVAYKLAFGDIPEGLLVCHKCDTPSCINPNHLFIGTSQDNINDRTVKNRGIKGSTVGVSKLKESDIQMIRADTRTQQAIANDYNVSQAVISSIILRKTWKHI